jgi:UDP-N-acetylglucosamine--N-acetylmuramyl-(pentapeptide) pyrophosphoryl-undecaprenol N-acetylglucosamine transferase
MVTILIAGGGTGGHVFPMVAVGDAIRRLDAEARVVYVGTARGLEARVIPERGDPLELLNILPLRGDGARGFARGALRAAASLPEARALVRHIAPAVVLSVGGYAAGPVSLAARSLGVPVAILEPNSALGLANRLLAPLARRAYTAFPEVERHLRPSIVLRAGVPLRKDFAPMPYERRGECEPMRVLVLGGSQGASALNETVPRAIAKVTACAVVHQTGPGRDEAVRALYASLGVEDRARVVPFIEDMHASLTHADLVVGRAGASSLAELTAIGRPALLIPYPFAADDHQLKNAQSLERAGAAVAIAQSEATEERLARELAALARDGGRRAQMAEASSALGHPGAATEVAKDLLTIARFSRDAKKRKRSA